MFKASPVCKGKVLGCIWGKLRDQIYAPLPPHMGGFKICAHEAHSSSTGVFQVLHRSMIFIFSESLYTQLNFMCLVHGDCTHSFCARGTFQKNHTYLTSSLHTTVVRISLRFPNLLFEERFLDKRKARLFQANPCSKSTALLTLR